MVELGNKIKAENIESFKTYMIICAAIILVLTTLVFAFTYFSANTDQRVCKQFTGIICIFKVDQRQVVQTKSSSDRVNHLISETRKNRLQHLVDSTTECAVMSKVL